MDVSTLLNPALEMTPEAQQRVTESLYCWLAESAVKRPVPDFDVRLAAMQTKLKSMAKGLRVEMLQGRVVVSASGDAQGTWCLLKRGSNWFEPHPNPEMAVVVEIGRAHV